MVMLKFEYLLIQLVSQKQIGKKSDLTHALLTLSSLNPYIHSYLLGLSLAQQIKVLLRISGMVGGRLVTNWRPGRATGGKLWTNWWTVWDTGGQSCTTPLNHTWCPGGCTHSVTMGNQPGNWQELTSTLSPPTLSPPTRRSTCSQPSAWQASIRQPQTPGTPVSPGQNTLQIIQGHPGNPPSGWHKVRWQDRARLGLRWFRWTRYR